jgi:phospholipid transport system substrate-binding protein
VRSGGEQKEKDMRVKRLLSMGMCIILLTGSVGLAGPPSDTVRRMLDAVMAIQSDPGLQGPELRGTRRMEIKKIIVTNFNFEDMSQHALGARWKSLTPAQRAEFRSVFQDLFLDSYSRLVLDFLKKEKIAYNGEEATSGRPMVRTTIQRVNEEIPVDYFLTDAGGRLLVRDVTIDGVSIVDNYRKTFARTIKRDSYDGLLKKMKLQQQAIK